MAENDSRAAVWLGGKIGLARVTVWSQRTAARRPLNTPHARNLAPKLPHSIPPCLSPQRFAPEPPASLTAPNTYIHRSIYDESMAPPYSISPSHRVQHFDEVVVVPLGIVHPPDERVERVALVLLPRAAVEGLQAGQGQNLAGAGGRG